MLVVRTPLRISFAGGGTDFADFYEQEGGCVVSSAINKYTFVIVKESWDRKKIYLNWSQKEIRNSVDEIEHELIREAMRYTGVLEGVEVTTLADIPSEGSGLGSSSSILVGLLNGFHQYQGRTQTAESLAQEACHIEVDLLGKPIGKQDQYIAAYGGLRFFQFLPGGKVRMETVAISEAGRRHLSESLMLFFSGATRSSASVLTEQKSNIQSRLEELRELKAMALEAKGYLEREDLEAFGKLLHRGWEVKKRLASGITHDGIDEIYAAALKAGALGGKITGAGGGGFLLLYCPRERQDRVRAALRHLREVDFGLAQDGSKVIFNMRP